MLHQHRFQRVATEVRSNWPRAQNEKVTRMRFRGVEWERVFEFAPGGLSFMELARLGARFEDHCIGSYESRISRKQSKTGCGPQMLFFIC